MSPQADHSPADMNEQGEYTAAVALEPFEVQAGQAVGAVMRDLGLPNKGDQAVVVVQDSDGNLKDLSHVPVETATFMPVAANTSRTSSS